MIKLSGPSFVEAGSKVCITATNIGPGFSATAVSSGASPKLTIVINQRKKTATICFIAPGVGKGVILHVGDNAGPKGVSHSVISHS